MPTLAPDAPSHGGSVLPSNFPQIPFLLLTQSFRLSSTLPCGHTLLSTLFPLRTVSTSLFPRGASHSSGIAPFISLPWFPYHASILGSPSLTCVNLKQHTSPPHCPFQQARRWTVLCVPLTCSFGSHVFIKWEPPKVNNSQYTPLWQDGTPHCPAWGVNHPFA